jgi:hypothetical protein
MAATFTTPRIVGMAKACEVIFTGRLYRGRKYLVGRKTL